MSLLGSIFPGDKELGKKDDDHRPSSSGPILPGSWNARKQVTGIRRRRVVYAVLGLFALFLFIKNIPTDLGSNSLKTDSRVLATRPNPGLPTRQDAPTGKPPRPSESSGEDEHYFSGPVKFYNLAATLHSVASLAGRFGNNKNILFAAASLKSASEIMPLACEMASIRKNDVHFAFMGREDLEIHEIKEINGINDDDCAVHWHDGRPDFSRWSSDFRMEVSVTAGLAHIQRFVLPQAIFIDNAEREESFFVNSIKSKATELGTSLIELPTAAAENMMWVTRLDSGSLAAWQTTYVDLLIHAPPKSSGSLIRLLKSIEEADYFGYRRPHVTIELPAEIDASTYNFLENMIWPPLDWSGGSHSSQLTLRHRIPKRSFTAAEASSYFVESFYPSRPLDSHVLVLSPQVELSPLYYHYLVYNLLEHRYSKSKSIDNLMGISLELPTNFLNGSADFTPPTPKSKFNNSMPFLWEAPNSNAALYFGERWMEFHSFIANRVSTMKKSTAANKKQITESYPAWMEYLLELMRARGYAMFYPNYDSITSNAFAAVHSELYQAPEEYPKKPAKMNNDESPPPLDPTDSFETDLSTHAKTKPHPPEPPLLTSSLISLLSQAGYLPSLSTLPYISYDGQPASASDRTTAAADFAAAFRRDIGNCVSGNGKDANQPPFVERGADDLFCNLDGPPEALLEQTDDTSPTAASAEIADSNPDAYVNDEDAIPADSSAQIRDEFEAHLRRQSGQKETRTKGEKTSSEEYDPRVDEDKVDIIPTDERRKAKTEFEKHLARQGDKADLEDQDPSIKKGRIKGLDEKTDKQAAEKPGPKEKTPAEAKGPKKLNSDTGVIPGADEQQRDPGW